MKKLLAIAVLGSLFAGQAFAKTAKFAHAKYQIPKINKKELMKTKKAAEKDVSMYKKDVTKAQTMLKSYAVKGRLKQVANARAKLAAANLKYSRAINKLSLASSKLKK